MPDNPFLAEAVHIARRFQDEAIWHDDMCTWISRDLQEPPDPIMKGPIARTLEANLYAGAAGIALFLARLAALTGNEEQRRTALGAARHTLYRIESFIEERGFGGTTGPLRPSFYTGGIGTAWCGIEVAELLGDQDVLRRSEALLARYCEEAPLLARDNDVLGGGSGTIIALIDLHERGYTDCLAYALKIAKHILAQSRRFDDGSVAWPFYGSKTEPRAPLTGYSHGTAGYAQAFCRLYQATLDEAHLETARACYLFERRFFVEEEPNWLDLRDTDDLDGEIEPSFMTAWCHGAPGIGMQRQAQSGLIDGPEVQQEIAAATRRTRDSIEEWQQYPDWSFTMCHGLGGNIECYLEMLSIDDKAGALARAKDIALRRIQCFGHLVGDGAHPYTDWPMHRPGYADLSLLKGIAGIGHFMLRLGTDLAIPTIMMPGRSWRPGARNRTVDPEGPNGKREEMVIP